MAITLADFPDLSRNIKIEWDQKPADFPLVREQLAIVTPVTTQTSDHSAMSNLPAARRRSDGGNAYKATPSQSFLTHFTQTEIAIEMDVTKQLRMFDKYGKIMEIARNISYSTQQRMEVDIAAMLYNAWSTSYTNIDGETVNTVAPDGLALMHSAHTANSASNTYNNQVGAVGETHDPISPETLERLQQAANNFIDEASGRRVPTIMDTIITGDHAPTVNAVSRILNSTMYPGSSLDITNNATNNLKAMYKHLVVPFLVSDPTSDAFARTSSRERYCFLANLGNKDRNGFLMEVSQNPMLEAPEMVTESGIWQWVATAMYSFGLKHSNFIVGTKGDGSTIA